MRYEGIVYRPPSEAGSLIIQVTVGCAHNCCTFCTMYKSKSFRIRKREEICADLDEMAQRYGHCRLRIFLADGDALVLPTGELLGILGEIRRRFPYVQRITSYATARDVLGKSLQELIALHDAGLDMVYVGAESGDEEILKAVKKNLTCRELILAAEKLKESQIALSLTLISGLGGKERLREHAALSAKLVSAMKPEYLGFLTLMLEEDAPIMQTICSGRLTLPGPADVAEEMRIFLEHVDAQGTVFRANHASNYLTLKGTLNQDIPRMLQEIAQRSEKQDFRAEQSRRL